MVDIIEPSISVTYNGTNKSGSDYISYCWHNVQLQKFGTPWKRFRIDFVELVGTSDGLVKRAIANSSPDTSTNYSSWFAMDSLSFTTMDNPNHLMMNKQLGNL